jgi:CBS domain-containing protein
MNDMKVKDLMTRTVVTLEPDCPLTEAAGRLARAGISAAPVVEDEVVVGVLSESDLLSTLCPPSSRPRGLSILDHLTVRPNARPARHGGTAQLVRDAMSSVVFTVGPDDSVWTAARELQRRGVKRLPVTDSNGRLAGIISRADVVRAMARPDESIHADVLHALQSLGEESADVEVSVSQGFVTLSGLAHDHRTIQIATELASRVPGVAGVKNLIDEQPPGVELGLTEEDFGGLDPFVQRPHGDDAPADANP